ncbi:MAG: sensor domain-containing phosphodiesterase [Rhizobiaceae bacterium]|nr:sensor domain-containing phosphodiesterase [Rhizobiaceae bacterium]
MRWFILNLVILILLLSASVYSAQALEPVSVSLDEPAVDITDIVDFYPQQEDSLKVSTAADANGIVRRIEVQSRSGRKDTNWAVFALANTSNEQIDKLIVAPHYRLVSSGIIWPDLDAERIVAITPSEGFALEKLEDSEADVFLITLDPGAVITFVAEQNTPKLPKLYLWDPDAYKDTVNSYTLYRGIVLGISGLLAIFLTIIFVVKGSALFPATAALAWSVLAYICVDFGFWNKILGISTASEPIWRAGSEVFLSTSLLIFLFAYLNLNRWHSHFSSVVTGWILGLLILIGVAIIEPDIAAGIARLSFAVTGVFGLLVIVWLAIQRYDRAIMLIPTWIMILAWTFAAWMTASGAISNDVVQPALAGGLVLIVMLLGFTVMQHAFAGGVLAQGLVSNVERQALALTGANAIVWDWDVSRDIISTEEQAANILGVPVSTLNGPSSNWKSIIHPNDRDRFSATLDAVVEHRRGRIKQTFRLRSDEGYYHWFELRARPLLDGEGEVIRCVGTIDDVTAAKNSEERLLHDAVHDNLTGLANRQLFANRLEAITDLAKNSSTIRPSLFHINIDNFNQINAKYGISVGDTLLLTVARRLGRLLKDGDKLARFQGDQFVLMLLSQTAPDKIAAFADAIRKTMSSPIQFADDSIELTASIGIASWTKDQTDADRFIEDAELAMIHAKRFGGNRIEPFRPAFRTSKNSKSSMEEDLKIALEQKDISILFQPIVRLSDRITVGYEALARWKHPVVGDIPPSEFITLAENSGLIAELGSQVLERTIAEFSEVTKSLGDTDLFVAVNISSHELLRHDIVADISHTIKEFDFPPARLRIELTESLVMRNPEYSAEVLKRIKSLGVGLALDDFGTGYSSLSYLLRFPFDTIKIDKEFVQSHEHDNRLVVLRSIIALGHGLKQSLVAEGVETESDAAELLQLGCEFAQGYLFGEPVKSSEILPLLQQEYKMAGQ